MRKFVAIFVAIILTNAWLPHVVAFIAGLDKAGFTFGAVVGFATVVILGFLFVYALGHNAHVDTVEERKIAAARKEAAADRM